MAWLGKSETQREEAEFGWTDDRMQGGHTGSHGLRAEEHTEYGFAAALAHVVLRAKAGKVRVPTCGVGAARLRPG